MLDAIAFVFPFQAALQALSNAFTGTAPGLALPLIHLLALTLVFGLLARLSLRRFAPLATRSPGERGHGGDRQRRGERTAPL